MVGALVLPDSDDGPAELTERRIGAPISSDVCVELLAPPLRVVLRRCGVLRTAMPEAAVDEDRDLLFGEADVGPRAKRWREPEVDSKPIAACM